MDIFVARQPILSRNEDIIAYELLYRNSRNNSFSEIDGDAATIDLLVNCFVSIGNEKLAKGKKLYINFTRNLLLKRLPCLFPPEKIVIEILEDVEADDEVIAAIKEFKRLGYTIALDDFIINDFNKNFLPHADIIKVDFVQTSFVQRKILLNLASHYNILLLAEKIETRDDFIKALNEGFDLYQGYFFSKPLIISDSEVPFYPNDYNNILNELNQPEPCIDKITNMIEFDISLSYKILKMVNTFAYYTRIKVTSIQQAIVFLGLNELKKLITIITLKDHGRDTPTIKEIIQRSLIRAKLAELLAEPLLGYNKKSESFMVGLFSLLDTILQQPMKQVLMKLPLSEEVEKALLGNSSNFDLILQLISAMEKGDWQQLTELSPLTPLNLSSYYQEAVEWANNIQTFLEEV